MLELRTLGTIDLHDRADGRRLGSVLAQPKRLALFAYLVLARPRGFHQRHTLLGLFWPEMPEERGRHALRQALYQLRQSLGDGVLATRGATEIGVEHDAIRCDASSFEAELDRGHAARALALYGGELLDGFAIDGCPAFEEWLERRRSELRQRAVNAALSTSGDEALRWLRAALDWAPYDHAVVQALMQALIAHGQPAEALRAYAAYVTRLRQDLELEPAAALVGLAAAARSQAAAAAVPTSGATVPGAGGVATGPAVARYGAAGPGDRAGRLRQGGVLRGFSRATAIVAVVGAAVLFAARSQPVEDRTVLQPPASSARVLVASFEYPAGGDVEQVIAHMAADWIADGLARTGMVEVVPGSLLRREDSGPGSVAASAAAAGAGSTVGGTVYHHNGGVVVQVRISDATGTILRTIEHRGEADEDAAAIVERLRQRVMGALATVLDPRLAAWADAASQPPSFAAYQRFADGMDLFLRTVPDYRAAAARFRAAAELDTSFTAALIWAIHAHYYAAQMPVADSLAQALAPSRDRLAPWDRAMLDWLLAVLGQNSNEAYHAMRRVVAIAPASEWRHALAREALSINRPREALDILLELDPAHGWLADFPVYWLTRTNARHQLGDFAGELRDVELMRQRYPNGGAQIELRALAALGRMEVLHDRLAQIGAGLAPLGHARMVHDVARELSAHGHTAAAVALLDRALELYEALPAELQRSEPGRGGYARALFAAERFAEARPLFEELLAGRPGEFGFRALLGSTLARLGEHEAAERMASAIEQDRNRFNWGEDTLRRACIAAHLGDRPRAVGIVRAAFRHGLLYSPFIHTTECLFVLRGYAPFEALLQPRG